MCDFCGNPACTLTKQQVVERGAILESNAYGIMRLATEENPQTYSFKGVPAFYSLSALIPDEDEENPHAYQAHRVCAGAYKAGNRGGLSADHAAFIHDAMLK